MSTDITRKPDPAVCPRQFCFMWQMAKVITSATPASRSIAEGCRCPFGLCTRLNPEHGDHDWYESHEPNLREAGLPWFYFIPKPEKLVKEMQAEYTTGSEALWGREHWR